MSYSHGLFLIFSLLDALESGIVKIPRLPVETDTTNAEPEFRKLVVTRKRRPAKEGKEDGDYDLNTITLPTKLEEALLSLYRNYEKYYSRYVEAKKQNPAVMPPSDRCL